jgi:hypothetical protein
MSEISLLICRNGRPVVDYIIVVPGYFIVGQVFIAEKGRANLKI